MCIKCLQKSKKKKQTGKIIKIFHRLQCVTFFVMRFDENMRRHARQTRWGWWQTRDKQHWNSPKSCNIKFCRPKKFASIAFFVLSGVVHHAVVVVVELQKKKKRKIKFDEIASNTQRRENLRHLSLIIMFRAVPNKCKHIFQCFFSASLILLSVSPPTSFGCLSSPQHRNFYWVIWVFYDLELLRQAEGEQERYREFDGYQSNYVRFTTKITHSLTMLLVVYYLNFSLIVSKFSFFFIDQMRQNRKIWWTKKNNNIMYRRKGQ